MFYVFYEQYLTIVHDTCLSLGVCLAAVFVVSVVLMGIDLLAGVYVLLGVAGVILSMFGMMYFWDISLNAVSLVNLVMVSFLCCDTATYVTADIKCER